MVDEDRRDNNRVRRSNDLCYKMLKELIEANLKTIEVRIQGIEHATILRAREIDAKHATMNELRTEVITDRAQFIRKDVYEPREDVLRNWITDTNEKVTRLMVAYDNRMNKSSMISIGSLIVSVITVIILFLRVK
jgi:hypothetical protein